MFPEPLPLLRTGVVGNFQMLADPPREEYFDGHVQLGPDAAVIAVLAGTEKDPGAKWVDDLSNSNTVFGITEAGTVLAPIRSYRRSSTHGEVRAEVVRWHASNMLINAPHEEVDDDTVAATKLFYLGLGSWSGRPGHVDEPISDDGEPGWRIEVRSEQERNVSLDADFNLTIEHGWTLTGPPDIRSISRPLKIGFRSNHRRPLSEHVVRLDAVHGLLSVAHWKPVTAATGIAQLDPDSRKRAVLWDDTMTNETVEPDSNEFPIFTLADINDLEGLAAWVTICLTRPRAVTPIVRHRLFQNQTPESRLLSTAAAFEYWTASNARNPKARWARKVREHRVPSAISASVSDNWSNWIGDASRWAELFYGTYIQLKHTAQAADLDVVDALEYSGRWLLTASILDQCAGSSAPSERIFSGNGLRYPAPNRVRAVLDHAPIPSTAHR
ncbi:ApeA N-terminal domain 1-containing protein [Nocardioides stalactiti]|uniref:ApeA N-terminal domain 1-containing protein n=1 Tax=Nocardioides stalactiti TaxID=2755356 RepID=UPI00160265FF|nr:hypothetical protein [Nocardioides stalactiti]